MSHSPETRAKIAAAARARGISPETRAKMAAARRGQRHSEETKAKIAAANKGRKHTISYRTLESLRAMMEDRGERLRRWTEANPEAAAIARSKLQEGARKYNAGRAERKARENADKAAYCRALTGIPHSLRMSWGARSEQ